MEEQAEAIESQSTSTTAKKETGDALMKKKLKVLKQALKDEREKVSNVEKNLDKANEEIQNLKM